MKKKPHVRWRLVSEHIDWMCWEINGERIIANDPKIERSQKSVESLDERVISILKLDTRPRASRRP